MGITAGTRRTERKATDEAPRRQLGGDRRVASGSALNPPVSEGRVVAGRLAIAVTLLGWLGFSSNVLFNQFISPHHATTFTRIEGLLYVLVITLLAASALAYLICRLGFFARAREHQRIPRAALDEFFGRSTPTLTALIPSYKEEARVVRNTLLSAALQEYPYIRVVLLIDDPCAPKTRRDRTALQAMRQLAVEIDGLLAEPSAHFAEALGRFEASAEANLEEMAHLAGQFDYAVAWLSNLADDQQIVDHTDEFFADHVVRKLAADFSLTADALRSAAADGVVLPEQRIVELYRRLAWTFRADVSSFERKRYHSLSHEANKAMNLNSYLGLMGGSYREVDSVTGLVLLPASPGTSTLEIPDPDYVLTLDADSIVLPEYCARLVYVMEQSQHAKVAVVQTPYNAYPGAATRLERIAGASTDLQYIAHQGMTHYDATFWVGANAILRKRALDEVRTSTFSGNSEIRRYIQDRTVIEDTESTIDLRIAGWSLLNYPERLSYSATPQDFGSLCIQRRRWANGGLLIAPKLRRQRKAFRARGEHLAFGERFLRFNYMASIAWSSASLVVLLAFPFTAHIVMPLLGLITLPYFLAQASDLKFNGYKRLDVARIYGFNLVLLPVNLAGVANSILQAVTGEKGVFGRTPKVRDRTIPNLMSSVAPYLIFALAVRTFFVCYGQHRWLNAGYATANGLLTIYAIVAFIGLRHSVTDICVQLKARMYKPLRPVTVPERHPAAIIADPRADWAAVLHFGDSQVPALPSPAKAGAPAG